MNRHGMRMGLFAAAAILLTGCNTIDDVFGTKERAPLPGSRIPVLLSGDAVQPDPGISDLTVLLPKPVT